MAHSGTYSVRSVRTHVVFELAVLATTIVLLKLGELSLPSVPVQERCEYVRGAVVEFHTQVGRQRNRYDAVTMASKGKAV